MKPIIIEHATHGNLKDISIEIPRNKMVLLTGVSGSGKSTLAIDVLYQECQRQYLEAMAFQGIQKPKVEAIHNVSPAIQITQQHLQKNPRSTVGTQTNIYTDLRMIYEKLGKRRCPHCHAEINADQCKEEVEKHGSEFSVYMICSACHYKMEKLTRSYFSHNTREGACPVCEGMGKVMTIQKSTLFHENLSLEEGAVDFWLQNYKEYQIKAFYHAMEHYKDPLIKGTPLKKFTPLQRLILEEGVESEQVQRVAGNIKIPATIIQGKFEGVLTTLWRRVHDNHGVADNLKNYFTYEVCESCHGEKLQKESRLVQVMDTRLPQLTSLSLEELYAWVLRLEKQKNAQQQVGVYLLDLKTKLKRLCMAGLGYLSMERQMMTLSGGEAQRILLAAALDSDLCGILYILDEPTIGLHPKDTAGIITILKDLRDKENTILIIEHDIDMMKAADWIFDMGPGAGLHGGEIIAQGTYSDLLTQPHSLTGTYLKKDKKHKTKFRPGNGRYIQVHHAHMHNLKDIDVKFPLGCMTCVTGVSGSGKSTLVFDVLAKHNQVDGLEQFQQIIHVEQAPLTRMKRSNVATYIQLYTLIRKEFGKLKEAKEKGFTASDFSFNHDGGRCENCEGLGYVTSNMLFFEDIDIVCPVCGGKQFHEDLLSITYQGHSIHDVLKMTVEDASLLFHDHLPIQTILKLMKEVGLGYLELGQSLTTLSAGEGQRLKLAKELSEHPHEQTLYLIDEPTTGLHPFDVEHFIILLDKLVEQGNTVIVVEHNQQIINAADWVIDLGEEGGIHGGKIIAQGTPDDLRKDKHSVTGNYL